MIYQVLGYSDTYMPSLTLIIFFLCRRGIGKQEYGFLYFIIVNVLIFGASNVLFQFKINNLFLYHFYYLFELFFITHYVILQLLRLSPVLFYSITVLYTLLWLLDFFVWNPLALFNNYASIFERVIIIMLSSYYLLVFLKNGSSFKIYNMPGFFIALGFLFSSVFGVVSFFAYHYYSENNIVNADVNAWLFESIGTVLKFTFIITGFLCYKLQRRPPYH